MEREFKAADVAAAARRVAAALKADQAMLTELDQAVGDGDLGVTAVKLAEALEVGRRPGRRRRRPRQISCADRHGAEPRRALHHGHADGDSADAGGQESRWTRSRLLPPICRSSSSAATEGVRTRGKANLGDKTLLDALQPASDAFAAALSEGKSLPAAAEAMVAAARDGRDRVTPLRNRIGRASWLGERTEGKVDPGCGFAVVVLTALASA